MAIIYSYPQKSAALTDNVLISDSTSNSPKQQTKQVSISSIKDIIFPSNNVTGSGTANTIPKWSGSNTLTDSIIKDQGGVDVLIPRFIKHDGDTNNLFGFNDTGRFLVSVDATAEDQFSVAADSIIMKTDSGTKVAAGPSGVTLYSDTSDTATTTSVARFATSTTGVIIYGQTVAAGAASERGGIVRYYNNANNRYVGISGPVTTGTNYQIRLPDSVGTAGQVLKLNNPLIGGSTQDLVWGDASGGTTPASITGTTALDPSTFAATPYTFESTSGISGGGAPLAIKVASSTGGNHIAFYYLTNLSGTISQNGTNAVAYNVSSDYRLKENVVDMTGSVDRLKQLKPSRFNFISDGPSRTVDGFLAHEVSSIVPEAVTGSKDEVDTDNNIIPQGLDQSKLVPLLVGAIKELTARVEALEN